MFTEPFASEYNLQSVRNSIFDLRERHTHPLRWSFLDVLEKAYNEVLRKLRKDPPVEIVRAFKREKTVTLYRRNGHIREDEKAKIAKYYHGGIHPKAIARKFDCSEITIRKFAKFGSDSLRHHRFSLYY